MGKCKQRTDYRNRLVVALKTVGAKLPINPYGLKLSTLEDLCIEHNLVPSRFLKGWPKEF